MWKLRKTNNFPPWIHLFLKLTGVDTAIPWSCRLQSAMGKWNHEHTTARKCATLCVSKDEFTWRHMSHLPIHILVMESSTSSIRMAGSPGSLGRCESRFMARASGCFGEIQKPAPCPNPSKISCPWTRRMLLCGRSTNLNLKHEHGTFPPPTTTNFKRQPRNEQGKLTGLALLMSKWATDDRFAY